MKNNQNNNENIIPMLIANLDNKMNIYVGDPNIKYEYKRSIEKDACYDYIDMLETNGNLFEEDTDSCLVEDSDYVILKRYNNGSIEQLNILLSYEMYGVISSKLLVNPDKELFSKFHSKTKGCIENYVICKKDNYFSICPVINNKENNKNNESVKPKVRSL